MKTENAKGVVCPRCGNAHVVSKEVKRANGNVSTKYQCRNSECMFKFTPAALKSATKGAKHVTGKTSVFIDKGREAKQPGKRIVKHYADDGELVKESVYYERRRNRADIDQKRRL
jgi:transposase-like protein